MKARIFKNIESEVTKDEQTDSAAQDNEIGRDEVTNNPWQILRQTELEMDHLF